jgi:F0F1-type ATP synthase membrane subunit b/b'
LTLSAAILVATLFPQIALAAEESAEDQGSWLTLMFFAINFILFVFLLVYFAVPLAKKFFRDRAATIRSSLSRAETAFAEAQDLANRAAARMASLEAELKQLAEDLEAETAFQVARIRQIAESTRERIHRDTELTIAALIEGAQRRIRQRLANTAARLARELIERNFERFDQSRLIDNFTETLAEGASR